MQPPPTPRKPSAKPSGSNAPPVDGITYSLGKMLTEEEFMAMRAAKQAAGQAGPRIVGKVEK